MRPTGLCRTSEGKIIPVHGEVVAPHRLPFFEAGNITPDMYHQPYMYSATPVVNDPHTTLALPLANSCWTFMYAAAVLSGRSCKRLEEATFDMRGSY
jgi:hypothetical protein